MKHLYFIRHGQSEMNKAGLLAGSTNTPLTDEGRAQAKLAGQAAKELAIDLIIASPMSRAHETAKIMAQEIGYPLEDILLDERLVERDFGEREGTVWEYGIDLTGTVGLETIEAFHERIGQVLNFAKKRHEPTILIVAHGAVYRMFHELTSDDFTFVNITVKSNNAEIIKLI